MCVQYSRSFWYGEKCIGRSVKYVLIYKLSFFCFLYFRSVISLIADDLYVYFLKELAVNYIKNDSFRHTFIAIRQLFSYQVDIINTLT